MDNIKSKLNSRKFWAAFLGALMPVVCSYLSEQVDLWEAIQAGSAIIISYLFSQGAVDYASAKAIEPADG
jgi:hypothetical protein|tara:strand:- start:110 stop:319 length:210 start_codon:yes stop_codon:yes gene_type:complete